MSRRANSKIVTTLTLCASVWPALAMVAEPPQQRSPFQVALIALTAVALSIGLVWIAYRIIFQKAPWKRVRAVLLGRPLPSDAEQQNG